MQEHPLPTPPHQPHGTDDFVWCSVPLQAQDAFLFVGLALLVMATLFGKLSAVWVLITGVCTALCCVRGSKSLDIWAAWCSSCVLMYRYRGPHAG